jgi:NAD(P)-dependent dehydrogenase (short-subunit alcohol dehydrogenase family)
MADKHVVLITGGNTGLGLEVVKALYKSDNAYEIIMGSRSISKAEEAIGNVKKETLQSKSDLSILQVDITSDESIHKAFEQVSAKHGRVDSLVNNSGASFDHAAAKGEMTVREAFNAAWDVNVSGTHVMTHEFAPLLLKSSDPRLMFMTSGTSALSETLDFSYPPLARLNASPEAGWPKEKSFSPVVSYRSSKTGLNMLMRDWAKTLKNDGVKVFAISPGFLATGLAGIGPEQLKKVRMNQVSCNRVAKHTDIFRVDGSSRSVRGREVHQRCRGGQEGRRPGESDSSNDGSAVVRFSYDQVVCKNLVIPIWCFSVSSLELTAPQEKHPRSFSPSIFLPLVVLLTEQEEKVIG